MIHNNLTNYYKTIKIMVEEYNYSIRDIENFIDRTMQHDCERRVDSTPDFAQESL